jgi:hypothetical protein
MSGTAPHSAGYVPPRTDVKRQLVEIWEEIPGCTSPSRTVPCYRNDFFSQSCGSCDTPVLSRYASPASVFGNDIARSWR